MALSNQEWPKSSRQHRWRTEAGMLYRFEMMLREMGLSDFVYDEEEDHFCFRDGCFTFSRQHADTKLLLERDHRA